MNSKEYFIILLPFLLLILMGNCTPKKAGIITKVDTIDFSLVWINKSYLTQLQKLKSHAKLWNKYEISYIGLAPNGQRMEVIKKFWTAYSYKQLIINDGLTLIPDEADGTDTLKVTWIEKETTFVVKNDTLTKTTIDDPVNIIEALLYSGEYILNGKTITVKSNGQVEGFGDYDFLQTQGSDYDLRTINNGLDIVTFKEPFKSSIPFVAEFKNDSLFLSDFICEKYDTMRLYCLAGLKGELKYRLARKF